MLLYFSTVLLITSVTFPLLCSSGKPFYQSGGSGENTEEDSSDRPRSQVSRFLHGNCELSVLRQIVIYFDDIWSGSDPVSLSLFLSRPVAERPGHHRQGLVWQQPGVLTNQWDSQIPGLDFALQPFLPNVISTAITPRDVCHSVVRTF